MPSKLTALYLAILAWTVISTVASKPHVVKRGGPSCSHAGGSTGTHCAKMGSHVQSWGLEINDGKLDCSVITHDKSGDTVGEGTCQFKDGDSDVWFVCDGEDSSYITVDFSRDFSGVQTFFGDFIDFHWESKSDQPSAYNGGPLNTTEPDDNIVIDCYT